MDHDIHKYFESAVPLVKQVGEIVRENIYKEKTVDLKESRVDFVTETDKQVEEILINGLQSIYPNHKFIGEESTSEINKVKLTDDPTWIIDPVDGTMNFVHSNPCVGVSVGLYINKEPKVGIVYLPVFDYLFTAIENEGAFMNGNKIQVSKVKAFSDALVIIEGGSSREPAKVDCMVENFRTILNEAHGFRTSGSAVYNITSVASGGADCYLEFGCHAWDMAAGATIIKEAGGVIMDPSGQPFDIMSRRLICASTEELAKEICSKIKQNYPKRDDA
ncbi:inositol monophosphatase 1 [Halyomorpha halys]|uniref:inositol monophosphatase 1 n=1 Tax=Halyomorpha halys TaxID=286706 RepID=UPI0006D526D0|nr:inositol monophosphatase 1 [Halyomorpha halys]